MVHVIAAFGGSDRVAPRPSLRRSSSLRGEVPSRTPPPSWDMPSSAAEAGRCHVLFYHLVYPVYA